MLNELTILGNSVLTEAIAADTEFLENNKSVYHSTDL